VSDPVRIAVVGAGLVGRRHAMAVAATASATLACLVDPVEEARALAADFGVGAFASLDKALAAGGMDAVILATPNRLHLEGAMAVISAGLPVLVEKPLATDVAGALDLVEAAEAAGVPLATGHHRRHNPLIAAAKEMIEEGRLGIIATVHANAWFRKPDDYFHTAWRRSAGAGPVFINLIHDIDILRHLVGDIVEVQAFEANAVRGHDVEDTAVVVLRFANGALGTVNVCDAAVAPWSWELTARENSAYPATGEDAYRIGGTKGSLSLPNLTLWTHADDRGWWAPISATKVPFDADDPLVRQVEQFAAVVRDGVPPLVSGRDGLAALAVVEAVKTAAATGTPVRPRHTHT